MQNAVAVQNDGNFYFKSKWKNFKIYEFLTQFIRDFYNKLMKVFDNLQFQRKSNIKFQFQFSKVKFKWDSTFV